LASPEPIEQAIQELAKGFKCPKCRGDQGQVRRVRLPEPKLSTILMRSPGVYAFVSCALCGYTEIYDLAVYARLSASETAKTEADAPTAQRI
jgi:predicted nucleic-acid-binding Zn-ribbon protein